MKLTNSIPAAAISVVCGCASAAPVLDAATEEAVRSAVEQRVSGYAQAMRDGDVEYMLGFYANEENFVFADNGVLAVGYEAHAERLRATVESGRTVASLEISNPQIFVLSPNAASITFEFAWTMSDPEGNLDKAKGAWTYVFKEIEGTWQVVHSTGVHVSQ